MAEPPGLKRPGLVVRANFDREDGVRRIGDDRPDTEFRLVLRRGNEKRGRQLGNGSKLPRQPGPGRIHGLRGKQPERGCLHHGDKELRDNERRDQLGARGCLWRWTGKKARAESFRPGSARTAPCKKAQSARKAVARARKGAQKGAPKTPGPEAAAEATDPTTEDAKATTKAKGAPHPSPEPDATDPDKEAEATTPAARQEADPTATTDASTETTKPSNPQTAATTGLVAGAPGKGGAAAGASAAQGCAAKD